MENIKNSPLVSKSTRNLISAVVPKLTKEEAAFALEAVLVVLAAHNDMSARQMVHMLAQDLSSRQAQKG